MMRVCEIEKKAFELGLHLVVCNSDDRCRKNYTGKSITDNALIMRFI
jgi:hypothetical protein